MSFPSLPIPILFDILRPQLVAQRQKLKMSPQDCAQDLQVSPYQLAQWESGNSLTSNEETLRRWAALLDLLSRKQKFNR
jgi:transcriptional regulator with XRE-family HTH domain